MKTILVLILSFFSFASFAQASNATIFDGAPSACTDAKIRVKAGERVESCPCCGSDKLAGILYGKPVFSDKLKAELEAGRIILGGCVLSGDDPFMACIECQARFYRIKN